MWPSPPRNRRHAPDLTGAIDLLTADEARRLLLLSAQSNTSLAATIREIALARSEPPSMKQLDVHQSYLADTFRFDDPRVFGGV
jgi:flagellar biosynthesis/type III secretory pathway ATPase